MMFSFNIDGNGGTYICQLSFQFACYFVGIIFLYIAAIFFITDTNYFKENKVIVPVHVGGRACYNRYGHGCGRREQSE
jgi:hypothetical protein